MAGQEYGTATLGGNLTLTYLTDWLRYVAQPLNRFRQVCDVKEAIGTGKGNTFNWDIIANIATQGTTLAETDTMPASNFTITKGTCVVYEFGNSIPLTRLLKEMSQHEVKSIIRKTLANDMAKAYDNYIYNNCIRTTPLIAQADGGTSTELVEIQTDGTGDHDMAASCWLHTGHIINLVDAMKERNIPAFDGENYICIAHPTTLTNLRNQLVSVNQYTESGYKKILYGEIGMFGGVRFIEQTNVAKTTADTAAAVRGRCSSVARLSLKPYAVPDEIIEKEVTDYGRSLGLAWYGITGFAPAFTHSYSASSDNARVVLWWPNDTNPIADT